MEREREREKLQTACGYDAIVLSWNMLCFLYYFETSVRSGSSFLKIEANRTEFGMVLIAMEKIRTIHFYLELF